jgi:predicted aspartyl protease
VQGQTQSNIQLPFQIGRSISILASLNGSPNQPLCFDTGLGGELVISSNLANSLHLNAIGSTTLSDPTGEGALKVSTTRLDSLQIGTVVFRKVDATIQPDSPMTEDCKGVIGLELFHNYILTIDLPDGYMRLDHGSLSSGGSGTMPYESDHGIPKVRMVVGKTTLPAHIDTMGQGLALPISALKTLHPSAPPEVIGRGRTVSGDFEIKGAVVDDTIQLGPFNYKGSFVEFNEHFPIANLGLASLRTFTISFDQIQHLVQFSAPSKQITIQPPRRRMAPPNPKPS